MSNRILIVEDNKDISKVLKLYIEAEGYTVLTAENGLEGLQLVKEQNIDLAIVDIMMPKMDGYELTQEIRKISHMPILILSAKGEHNDRILGLNLGADDYITKPFNPLEIVARVNSALRRYIKMSGSADVNDGIVQLGNLKLDTNTCLLTKDTEEIPLTATEYKLLTLFIKSPNRIYSKIQLSEHVYGEYFESNDSAMAVHISHIREKLGDNLSGNSYIKTVRGLGYKFEEQ